MANALNFTEAALRALPLSAKRVRYMDARTPGLALSVTATAKTFYYYRYDRQTKRPMEVKLGVFPEMSVTLAREAAAKAYAATLAKEDPRKAVGRADERTFGELAEWWLVYAEARKKSVGMDKAWLEGCLAPLKNLPLSRVTRGELRRLHESITRDHGPAYANRSLMMVRAMFNRARRHELFSGDNPAEGLEWHKEHSRERRLMPHEMAPFFAAVEAEPSVDIQDYVLLSLYTGARQANVLGMRWSELNLEAGTWYISETKNGLPQVVTLPVPAVEILTRRKAAAEKLVESARRYRRNLAAATWVFATRSKTGHMTEPKVGWRRIKDRAIALGCPSLDDLRLHDLRRSLGSWMADTGTGLNVIGKALGHQSTAATTIYARLSLDPVRQAQTKAIEAMMSARRGGSSAGT